jgi:predicted butyrate kinase (DUF1464 family)
MTGITMNAPLTTNKPIYANGPVYIMGMDIKAEIERIKKELEQIKEYEPEKIEKIVKQLLEKEGIISSTEKSKLKVALETFKEITDLAEKVKFWYEILSKINNPFLHYLIIVLLKLNQ